MTPTWVKSDTTANLSKLIQILNFIIELVLSFLHVIAEDEAANVVVNNQVTGISDVTEERVELFLEVGLYPDL